MIAPIIFLGAAAKHLGDKKEIARKFKDLSDKILALADQDDILFQKKLGNNVPSLLIFFGDIEAMIKQVLSKV